MLPLKGIRVLDLAVVNGFTGMDMADYGAEVIKVERPQGGDPIRDYPPMKNGISLYQAVMDRGKKSITLDLKSEKGKNIFKELVKTADVLIENLVGTMDKLGLGYDELSKINPKLVYGQLTGYGNTGPEKGYIAYDIAVQAKAGILDITGQPDPQPPMRVGAYIGDHYSCKYLTAAIEMALFYARKTGTGQKVSSSMFEALFSVTEDKLAIHDLGDKEPTRTGNAHPAINPYDIVRCKDGYMALGISTDDQWYNFCIEFDKKEWAEDPRYSTNGQRGLHYFGDLREKLENFLVENFSKDEITARCAKAKVPAAPCNTIEEAIHQEQIKARDMLIKVHDQRIGDVYTVGKIVKFHDKDNKHNGVNTAPLLGQHNDEIYGQLLSKEQIAELKAQGVI